MAFSSSKKAEIAAGNLRVTYGSFTSGSTTGGDIYTGLQKVFGIYLIHNSSTVVGDQPAVNETFPVADPVTIVTTSSKDGYWLAWGA